MKVTEAKDGGNVSTQKKEPDLIASTSKTDKKSPHCESSPQSPTTRPIQESCGNLSPNPPTLDTSTPTSDNASPTTHEASPTRITSTSSPTTRDTSSPPLDLS